jgi:hypothetical protein
MAVTTSIAELYEKHIRALPAAQRLELVAMIARELAAEGSTRPDRPTHHLRDLRGLGKGLWDGIDAQEYVDRLRGPWPDEVPRSSMARGSVD